MVVALLCTYLTPLCVNRLYLVALIVWNLYQFLFPQLFFLKRCLCLLYHPPSSPVSTFDKLCAILHLLNPIQFSNFIILGDFNVNFLDQKSYLISYVRDVLDSFSFSQIVPSFTHVSPSGTKSLIDLALLLRTEHLQHCTTVPPFSTSDHLGVSISLQWKLRPANPTKSRKIWLYNKVIILKLKNVLLKQTGTVFSQVTTLI